MLIGVGLLSTRWLSTRFKEGDRLWHNRSPSLPNAVAGNDPLPIAKELVEPEHKAIAVEDTRFSLGVGELGRDFGKLANCGALSRLRLMLGEALGSAVLSSKTESELVEYIYEVLVCLDLHISSVDFYIGTWELRAAQGNHGQDPRTGIALSSGSRMALLTEGGNLTFTLEPTNDRGSSFDAASASSEILSRPDIQAQIAKSGSFEDTSMNGVRPYPGTGGNGNVDCQKDHRLQIIRIARERLSNYSSIVRNTPRIQRIPVAKELFPE